MAFLICPKGCVRRVSRFQSGRLHFHGLSQNGSLHRKSAQELAIPPDLARDYRDMTKLAGLRDDAPVLECYDDLHGVGGLFDPNQWVILVGAKDMADIAKDVVRRWGSRVMEIYAAGRGEYPTQEQILAFARSVATRRCLAHELGHALLFRGARNPYAPDEEAGADYYAGRIDGARNVSRELGEMFFHAIGCTGSSCTHPEPAVRQTAYRTGYTDQQDA